MIPLKRHKGLGELGPMDLINWGSHQAQMKFFVYIGFAILFPIRAGNNIFRHFSIWEWWPLVSLDKIFFLAPVWHLTAHKNYCGAFIIKFGNGRDTRLSHPATRRVQKNQPVDGQLCYFGDARQVCTVQQGLHFEMFTFVTAPSSIHCSQDNCGISPFITPEFTPVISRIWI